MAEAGGTSGFGSGGANPQSGFAFGTSTISAAGGAVSDLFSAKALRMKGQGSRIEAQQYDLAAELAFKNEAFAKTSTAIKDMQAQREIYQGLGQQRSEVAAFGFADVGSSLDLLRDSAAQGALTKAVIGQQGLIEEAGYHEQAESYKLMASASRMAADADDEAAKGAGWSAAFKGAAAGASAGSLFGPVGTLVGGVVGAGAGYFGSK